MTRFGDFGSSGNKSSQNIWRTVWAILKIVIFGIPAVAALRATFGEIGPLLIILSDHTARDERVRN